VYGSVSDTDGTNKRKREKKRSFRVFVCKIIDLFLSDPHLSSIGGGRGAPVGYMFQIEKKRKEKA
jgi:hypothetical protein